jgi:DeoR/GlpR family transcriptional regulator of sugar metabolism
LRAPATPISLGDKLALSFSPEKLAIGATAADLIARDEWIFLGSGTTCAAIAYALQNRAGVNVVTNNLYVALLLSQNKASNVIMTIGQLQHERLMLGGECFPAPLSTCSSAGLFSAFRRWTSTWAISSRRMLRSTSSKP